MWLEAGMFLFCISANGSHSNLFSVGQVTAAVYLGKRKKRGNAPVVQGHSKSNMGIVFSGPVVRLDLAGTRNGGLGKPGVKANKNGKER